MTLSAAWAKMFKKKDTFISADEYTRKANLRQEEYARLILKEQIRRGLGFRTRVRVRQFAQKQELRKNKKWNDTITKKIQTMIREGAINVLETLSYPIPTIIIDELDRAGWSVVECAPYCWSQFKIVPKIVIKIV